MKKQLSRLFIIVVIASLCMQCKKKDDNPVSPLPETYSVDYKFQLRGSYLDLMISYYDASDQLREVSNPALPWELTLDDFEQDDSVFLHISYKIPPAPGSVEWGYEWDIRAYNSSNTPIDQSYTHGGSGAIPDTVPILIEWGASI